MYKLLVVCLSALTPLVHPSCNGTVNQSCPPLFLHLFLGLPLSLTFSHVADKFAFASASGCLAANWSLLLMRSNLYLSGFIFRFRHRGNLFHRFLACRYASPTNFTGDHFQIMLEASLRTILRIDCLEAAAGILLLNQLQTCRPP